MSLKTKVHEQCTLTKTINTFYLALLFSTKSEVTVRFEQKMKILASAASLHTFKMLQKIKQVT